MSKKIAISIEDSSVKIVYAILKGGVVDLTDFITISTTELEDFLREEKERNFLLNIHFNELVQDTFYLPPTSDRDIKKLILKELQMQNPDIKEWLFYYSIVGERVEEGKRLLNVSVFAVPEASVNERLRLFLSYGKIVDSLIPNYLPLLNLIPNIDIPALYLYKKGADRIIMLLIEGSIYLMRKLTGDPSELNDSDIQDLNMTVNYSKQRLGIDPEYIYLIGQQKLSDTLVTLPVRPVSSLLNPNIKISSSLNKEDLNEYILPVSMFIKKPFSISTFKTRRPFLSSVQNRKYRKSFLPSDYRFYRGIRTYVSRASVIMVLFSVLLAGLIPIQGAKLESLKSSVNQLRQSLSDVKIINNRYQTELERWKKYEKNLRLINTSIDSLVPNRFIKDISTVTDSSTIMLNSISINRQRDVILFNIKGEVIGGGLLERQKNYGKFKNSIKNLKGVIITDESIYLEEGKFTINGRFKT